MHSAIIIPLCYIPVFGGLCEHTDGNTQGWRNQLGREGWRKHFRDLEKSVEVQRCPRPFCNLGTWCKFLSVCVCIPLHDAVKVVVDKKTKQSLGFAYVWFTREEHAGTAIEKMNGQVISILSLDSFRKLWLSKTFFLTRPAFFCCPVLGGQIYTRGAREAWILQDSSGA